MYFCNKHFARTFLKNSLLNSLLSGNPDRVCSSRGPQDGYGAAKPVAELRREGKACHMLLVGTAGRRAGHAPRPALWPVPAMTPQNFLTQQH
jgi:hypothetical protein